MGLSFKALSIHATVLFLGVFVGLLTVGIGINHSVQGKEAEGESDLIML